MSTVQSHNPTAQAVDRHISGTKQALSVWSGRRKIDFQGRTQPVQNVCQVIYRTRALFLALNEMERRGGLDVSTAQILDVGSASGYGLKPFLLNGFALKQLHGIDLFRDRIELGGELLPGLDLTEGDATNMPEFTDSQFDVCCEQFCFCHIPDDEAKPKIAAEMLRVTKPGGFLIIHDWKIGSEKRMLYGMSRKKISNLFRVGSETEFFCRFPSQLFPIVGRPLSRYASLLYPMVMRLAPPLVGSYFTVLRRS